MAAAAASRDAATVAVGVLRQGAFNFFRALSSSSAASPAPSAASAAAEAAVEKKPKRKKKKNLFEVAQFLPDWGVGYNLAKNHWQGISYKITKINLYKDGRHGKAWGIFYKDGLPAADAAKKISGVHKRGWRYIPQSRKKKLENTPNGAEQSSPVHHLPILLCCEWPIKGPSTFPMTRLLPSPLGISPRIT